MKGNTLDEFINDIISICGPEKEFLFKNRRYFLDTSYNKEKEMYALYIYELKNNKMIFDCFGKTLADCFEKFEKAKIFEGETIYEAERQIEVLFG